MSACRRAAGGLTPRIAVKAGTAVARRALRNCARVKESELVTAAVRRGTFASPDAETSGWMLLLEPSRTSKSASRLWVLRGRRGALVAARSRTGRGPGGERSPISTPAAMATATATATATLPAVPKGELIATAAALATRGKGILACDESVGTIGKRELENGAVVSCPTLGPPALTLAFL
jgi:hypothetical protein